jgi:predicted Zn finger-like uncharacterized protein
MSLATRCTACGTVFRVVQDQLKVSEGWVRCGRCSEVFNALEGLFDLEGASGPVPLAREPARAGAAVEAPLPPPGPLPPVSAPVPEPPAFHPPPVAAATPDHADAADDRAAAEAAPSTLIATTQADSRVDSVFAGSQSAADDHVELVDSAVPDDALWAQARAVEPPVGFLQAEARAAMWRRPRVQRSLMVLAALLGTILALQVANTQRDALAAHWPQARPLLAALCGGCELEAPRAVGVLAVDSSGLTRIEGSPYYRLQVTLRNRGATDVLAPALDLTLTDLRGDVVARRVLRPADFLPSGPRQLDPGSEWPINAVLDVGETRVAGYNVELFYP